jgi:hypothetical protein
MSKVPCPVAWQVGSYFGYTTRLLSHLFKRVREAQDFLWHAGDGESWVHQLLDARIPPSRRPKCWIWLSDGHIFYQFPWFCIIFLCSWEWYTVPPNPTVDQHFLYFWKSPFRSTAVALSGSFRGKKSGGDSAGRHPGAAPGHADVMLHGIRIIIHTLYTLW